MAIANRENLIEAHRLAIEQLQRLSGECVSGDVKFGAYRETLPVKEVVVEYTARGQRSRSTITIKVGEVTETPHNRSGTKLSLPYSSRSYHVDTGYGADNPPIGILVVEDSPTYHRVWIRLSEQADWKSCQGEAESWTID